MTVLGAIAVSFVFWHLAARSAARHLDQPIDWTGPLTVSWRPECGRQDDLLATRCSLPPRHAGPHETHTPAFAYHWRTP